MAKPSYRSNLYSGVSLSRYRDFRRYRTTSVVLYWDSTVWSFVDYVQTFILCYKIIRGLVLLSPDCFYRAMLCIRGTSHMPVSVCLSLCVCLSQVGVLLKRLNRGSHKQHRAIAQGV